MSYILEALKKAQAERQLGTSPTIHAPAAAPVPAPNAVRKPLVAGVAAGALLAAAGLLIWHQQPARVQVAAVAPAPVKAAAATAPVRQAAVADEPAPHVALVGKADPPARPAAPEPAAVARPAAPVVTAAAKAVAPAAVRPAPAPVQGASVAPVPAPAAVQPAAPVGATVAAEDAVRSLNELPEAVRRDLPKVAFGGYMYSPNPADRLVLVDNILRREGEEVAPGLVLEKLLPKGAVLNYRGSRYRVAF
jgi:general secretion pathway protein B